LLETVSVIALMGFLTFIVWRQAQRVRQYEPQEDEPTKEELEQLREVLKIEKGSLSYKSGSVYNIVYQNKKHVWNCLGSWLVLKEQLEA